MKKLLVIFLIFFYSLAGAAESRDAGLIVDSQMSAEVLNDLFKQAIFKTEREDDDLSVQMELGGRVRVHVDASHSMLRFYKIFAFTDAASAAQKASLMNRINSTVVLVRASSPEKQPGAMYIDYFLPYEEGLTKYQIISTLKYFSAVAMKAVNQSDTENIIK